MGGTVLCPGCLAVGTLVYTGQWVKRGSNWPTTEGIKLRETSVPMCRCKICRKRLRVLPLEMLPFKSYTWPAIELGCRTYTAANRPTESLRHAVERLGKGHPHRSTLHGWLGGLGARALGRLDLSACGHAQAGRHSFGMPVAALIDETARRLKRGVSSWWTQAHPISVCKYRTENRRKQLEACARLFAVADRLFPDQVHTFAWLAWEHWLQTHFHVAAWDFPARLGCTAIQHPLPRRRILPCAPLSREARQKKKGHVHGARSPP